MALLRQQQQQQQQQQQHKWRWRWDGMHGLLVLCALAVLSLMGTMHLSTHLEHDDLYHHHSSSLSSTTPNKQQQQHQQFPLMIPKPRSSSNQQEKNGRKETSQVLQEAMLEDELDLTKEQLGHGYPRLPSITKEQRIALDELLEQNKKRMVGGSGGSDMDRMIHVDSAVSSHEETLRGATDVRRHLQLTQQPPDGDGGESGANMRVLPSLTKLHDYQHQHSRQEKQQPQHYHQFQVQNHHRPSQHDIVRFPTLKRYEPRRGNRGGSNGHVSPADDPLQNTAWTRRAPRSVLFRPVHSNKNNNNNLNNSSMDGSNSTISSITSSYSSGNDGAFIDHLPILPAIPYLGTLLDAGRHYFPVPWIKRMLDHLAMMNYNLLHFRLTDDQAFNVMLKSHPELAYPSAFNNPHRAIYSVEELREIKAYADSKGILIMPEINVPGHAGAWAGIPHMIVHCPTFICEKGYGLPLNVTHHALRTILADILNEIIDIFDPPFLHLGGDEVNMADPCFHEVGSQLFNYSAFEMLLREIIHNDVGYPEERIVRWEMTGQKAIHRVGAIEQFWESHPGVRRNATGKFFMSTWLYFDTNGDQDAFDVYERTRHTYNLIGGQMPTAIIAGTFELSMEFWFDRNVLGRLLAVAMGASNNITYPARVLNTAGQSRLPPNEMRPVVNDQYVEYCSQLGWGNVICNTQGRPVISTNQYYINWRAGWDVWKRDICERLTTSMDGRIFRPFDRSQMSAYASANDYYWGHFPIDLQVSSEGSIGHLDGISGTESFEMLSDSVDHFLETNDSTSTNLSDTRHLEELRTHTIRRTGVILDVSSSLVIPKRLQHIIQHVVAKLGFNMIQLPLVTNYGFVYESRAIPKLSQSVLSSSSNPVYDVVSLLRIAEAARELGITIMPEVSMSTDAGGWFKAGFLANCPEYLCQGHGVPIDVNNIRFPPVLFGVIAELQAIFKSPFLHLGSDERNASLACFQEQNNPQEPDFDRFEEKMSSLFETSKNSPAHILRWENEEHARYANRTGEITQYRAGSAIVPSGESNSPFFATVDILEGSAWDVYRRTIELVALRPLGIMAEIRTLTVERWQELSILRRLLAFGMGVSRMPLKSTEESFSEAFAVVCEEVGFADSDCLPPIELGKKVEYVTSSEQFIEAQCTSKTEGIIRYFAREVTPYFVNPADSASTRLDGVAQS